MATERLRRRRAIIKDKRDGIMKDLEPSFEFLDYLISKDVFASEVIEEIQSVPTRRGRIEIMLTHLKYVDEGDYGSFIEALLKSKQKSIVNFINGKFFA